MEVEVDGLIQGAERMDTDPPSNLKASRMSGSRLEATKGHLQPYGSLLLSLMRKINLSNCYRNYKINVIIN